MKKIILILILLFCAFFVKAQSSTRAKTTASYIPNQLIVKFKKEVSITKKTGRELIINNATIYKLHNELGGVTCERILNSAPKNNKDKSIINDEPLLYKFQSNQDIELLIPYLLKTGFYEYVEPNYIIKGDGVCTFVPSDFYFNSGRQWGLINTGSFNGNAVNDADIDMEFGWGITKGNSDVTVAVLDAGTKLDHYEFNGRLWTNAFESIGNINDDDGNGYIDDINGWDFVNSDNDPTDDNGHGTNVIGIIGATGNNGVGYAGVDWNCKLMTCKVLDSLNSGSTVNIIAAIYYAVDNGADVINMSLGSSSFSTAFEAAINYAYINNVVTVASMGNNNDNVTRYPAGYANCIAVGATDTDNKRANPFSWSPTSGSNFGSHIDVVAPGNYIYGLDHITGNNYNIYYSGTSQSAPLVTGVVSLIKGLDNSISPDSIRSLLHNTSVDLIGDVSEDTPGWDQYYGHGLLNAYNALKEIVTGKDTITICSGESYTFPDGSTMNNITSSHVNTSTILSSSFCDSTVITYLFVDSTVFANATDVVITLGDSVILYGSGATNYTWDNGVIDSVAFTPDSTTTYTVTGNVSGNCNTDTITITVKTLPDLAVTSSYYSSQCPGDTLSLTNINDSSYTYYWTLNGIVLDTSYHLNFIVPDSGSNWFTHQVWLHVSNGIDKDSIKITITTNPSKFPQQFVAWADSIVNCDGTYSLNIYPVFRKTSYPYTFSNRYYYHNGNSYLYLSDPYLLSYSGDTATYSISTHPDSIISIRATSVYCGGNNNRDTILLPSNYYDYDFNLYSIDTDKEKYCSYDTVRVKIPSSEPGAKYSIGGGGISSNPIYGTGDTIEVFGWGNGALNSYYSNFSIAFESIKGCIKSKLDTVYFEGVDPQFQFVLDGVNPANASYFYSPGDSVLLNLKEDTSTVNCVWTIESDLFDTTYSNCTDHYFIVNHPGNYTFTLTKTSLLGCIFESESKELFVAAGTQNLSQNLNCAFDTAFNTSWDYNYYQTLDIHQDKMGNFHLAGFSPNTGSAGPYKPVSFYQKYSKNKQPIYQRVKAAYSNLYWNSYFLSEHLNSVTTDENLNVYTSGQFYTTGNFRNDSTIQYNSSGYNHFVYIAKHDSANVIKSLLLYVPYSTNSKNHQPVFSDVIYHQNKIYALFNGSYAKGTFLEYDKQNQNWINSINSELGMHLVIMDSSLHILDIEKVTSSWNSSSENYNTGSTSTSAFNNRAAKLAVDKQGRILIHYVLGYGASSGYNFPIEYGNTTLASNYSLHFPYSASALATYDPVNGWINGTIIASGYVRNHNYVINNLESDIHGNKYVLSNFTFNYYPNSGPYSYNTNVGVVGLDTVTQISSTISKLDVNNNFIWNKHFQNCDVVDMRLTRDEEHVGIIVNAKGNKFYYGDSDTSMLEVNLNGNSTVFMQFSNNGLLEKIYEYGNGVKSFKGEFLHFNDDGYFQLNTRISNTDSTDFILNGDTLISPPYNPSISSTHYNYVTFTIDGENGQCSETAYSGGLNDTLFLYIQNLDLCEGEEIFIPWVATDTINQVNIGYYLNGGSTKVYITNNLNANDYGYLWSMPNFNNLDSLKFFIESTSPSFYYETDNYTFNKARDIVLLNDTTFCLSGEVRLIPLDTFDLQWSPSQYFSNPELDSIQVLTLSDSTIIYVEERTDINSCVNKDTININVIPLLVETDSISICVGDSVFLSGAYQNLTGTYIDSLQSYSGCDSIFSTTLTVNPLPNVTIASFNPDTLCENSNSVILPTGLPIGGIYSGAGVTANSLDPSAAGYGTHEIIYTYIDANSCKNSDTTIITVEICTGVGNDGSNFGIIIYPNPNNGFFTIEKPSGLNKELNIQLFDGTSRLIIDKIIPKNLQKTNIDISKYSKGIYYLKLGIDGELFIRQILNQ